MKYIFPSVVITIRRNHRRLMSSLELKNELIQMHITYYRLHTIDQLMHLEAKLFHRFDALVGLTENNDSTIQQESISHIQLKYQRLLCIINLKIRKLALEGQTREFKVVKKALQYKK